MRLVFSALLALILAFSAAEAQSVMDNLPPVVIEGQPSVESPVVKEVPTTPAPAPLEPYTVADVSADVTADTAAHARDQALLQAQRAAYSQLCARLGSPDNAAKLSDDVLASLVQSYEVQSERVSAVRYIGVYTIRFKPLAMQKHLGAPVVTEGNGGGAHGPVSHVAIAVQTDSLAVWAQTKRRLSKVPQVARVDTLDLGRGVSHIDLSYSGSPEDLVQALMTQGLVLRQNENGGWELIDRSVTPQ